MIPPLSTLLRVTLQMPQNVKKKEKRERMGKKKSCCPKEGLNRGAWKPEEDKLLSDYIKAHGEGHWTQIPHQTGLKRCGKSCRLRWKNYLKPDIKRGNITPDEDDLIIRLHSLLGNRWALIAGRLPGRTDNEIKNHWNSHLAKRLLLHNPKTPTSNHNQPKILTHNTASPSTNNNCTVIRTKAIKCTKPLIVTGPIIPVLEEQQKTPCPNPESENLNHEAGAATEEEEEASLLTFGEEDLLTTFDFDQMACTFNFSELMEFDVLDCKNVKPQLVSSEDVFLGDWASSGECPLHTKLDLNRPFNYSLLDHDDQDWLRD